MPIQQASKVALTLTQTQTLSISIISRGWWQIKDPFQPTTNQTTTITMSSSRIGAIIWLTALTIARIRGRSKWRDLVARSRRLCRLWRRTCPNWFQRRRKTESHLNNSSHLMKSFTFNNSHLPVKRERAQGGQITKVAELRGSTPRGSYSSKIEDNYSLILLQLSRERLQSMWVASMKRRTHSYCLLSTISRANNPWCRS